jgi:ribosomal-protein-alanine N-acetyltransferase
LPEGSVPPLATGPITQTEPGSGRVVVRTRRLVLRPAEWGDLAAMHAVLSHPAATRYWSTPPHRTLEETEAWLGSMIAGSGDDFVIVLGTQVIGKAGFFQDPEIGYILHPQFTGQGYGIEAVSAVVDRALYVRGLPRIIADVDPRNVASLKLLGRLGFVETGRKRGTWQIGDELCDSVYLEKTAARDAPD